MMVPNAEDPQAAAVADTLTQFLNTSQIGSAQGLPTFSPVTAEVVWQESTTAINNQLYCGYRQVGADMWYCDWVLAVKQVLVCCTASGLWTRKLQALLMPTQKSADMS